MPDYGDILRFLAENPPQLGAERDLHASMLELLAKCLRNEESALTVADDELDTAIAASHERWIHFT